MRNNLNEITIALNVIDNNPRICMNFLDHPDLLAQDIHNLHLHVRSTNNKTTKMDIIFALIRSSVLQYNYPNSIDMLESKVREIYTFIDSRYDKYVWILHEVHFHTNFGQYVNCPFTTASEISEVLNKIIGDYFHA